MLAVFGECGRPADFTKKEYAALMGFAGALGKGKVLTGAQHQWLTAIYDKFISSKYRLEPMATDREFAARRAIRRARGPR